MIKHKTIDIPLLGIQKRIHFVSGPFEDYNSWFTKRYGEQGKEETRIAGRCSECSKDGWIEYVVYAVQVDDYPAIAHEFIHLINMIYDRKGISLSLVNDEHQAYFMQFLMKKWIEIMK